MTEYIYKLNLPDIREIILSGKYEEIFKDRAENISLAHYSPNTYLKKEYLTLKHYYWDTSLLFYKSKGSTGVLHSDLPVASWAINYINAGNGIMRYYDESTIGPKNTIPDNLNNYRLVWDTPISTVQSTKSYSMNCGVYLVRVDIPHIVTGFDNRYALSMRSLNHQQESWDTVVNNFCEFFI